MRPTPNMVRLNDINRAHGGAETVRIESLMRFLKIKAVVVSGEGLVTAAEAALIRAGMEAQDTRRQQQKTTW